MAKYKEDVSWKSNIEVVLNALELLHETEDGGWNLEGARKGVIYMREDAALVRLVGYQPVKLKIRLQSLSDHSTKMGIEGTAFGPGPLHARNVKRKAQDFKQKFSIQLEKIQSIADAVADGEIASGTRCPKCGANLPLGTRFCPNDGTEITRECGNCNQTNPPGAQYCVSCGNPL